MGPYPNLVSVGARLLVPIRDEVSLRNPKQWWACWKVVSGVKAYELWSLELGMPRSTIDRELTYDENSTMKDIKLDDSNVKEGNLEGCVI